MSKRYERPERISALLNEYLEAAADEELQRRVHEKIVRFNRAHAVKQRLKGGNNND